VDNIQYHKLLSVLRKNDIVNSTLCCLSAQLRMFKVNANIGGYGRLNQLVTFRT